MQALNEQLRRTSESRLTEERDKLHTVLRSSATGSVSSIRTGNPTAQSEGQRLWASTEAEVVGRPLPAIVSLSSGTSLTEPIFTQILLEETAQGDTFRTDDGLLTTPPDTHFPSPMSWPLSFETIVSPVPCSSFAISPTESKERKAASTPKRCCGGSKPLSST